MTANPLSLEHFAHLAECDPRLKPLTEHFSHIQHRKRPGDSRPCLA